MKTKIINQSYWPLLFLILAAMLLTNCKKKEEEPNPDTLTMKGVYSGTQKINDPSVGNWVTYTMTINFDNLTATSGSCANQGTVKKITSSTIEVDWPDGGHETVSYTLSNGTLTATGSIIAYSDNRTIPSLWNLSNSGNPQITGKYSGTQKINDPSVGNWVTYTMTINFDNLTATSGSCANQGTVKKITSSTIEVDWPDGGYETVSYTLSNSTITATGSIIAYSDNRTIPCIWNLDKQ